MRLFFKISGIVFILLVFLGCGYVAAGKRGTVAETQRFEHLSDDEGWDTKTGQKCHAKTIAPLPGFTNDEPNCADLAKQ